MRFAPLETSFHAANHTIPPPPSYEDLSRCPKDKKPLAVSRRKTPDDKMISWRVFTIITSRVSPFCVPLPLFLKKLNNPIIILFMTNVAQILRNSSLNLFMIYPKAKIITASPKSIAARESIFIPIIDILPEFTDNANERTINTRLIHLLYLHKLFSVFSCL